MSKLTVAQLELARALQLSEREALLPRLPERAARGGDLASATDHDAVALAEHVPHVAVGGAGGVDGWEIIRASRPEGGARPLAAALAHPDAKDAIVRGSIRGLHAVHSHGFLHRAIDPGSIVFAPRAGGLAPALAVGPHCVAAQAKSRASRGAADTRLEPTLVGADGGEHPLHHRPAFRPPESRAHAGGGVFAHGEKSDVWALGMALAQILSGGGALAAADPASERYAASARRLTSAAGRAALAREIEDDAVRLEILEDFGAAVGGRAVEDAARRRLKVRTILNTGAARGLLHRRSVDMYTNLLVRMLDPNPATRATTHFLLADPATGAVGDLLPPGRVRRGGHPATTPPVAPLGGWTEDKDAAAVNAVKSVLYERPEHLHLEAAFVAFSAAARVACGFRPGAHPALLFAATAAAARLAAALFDPVAARAQAASPAVLARHFAGLEELRRLSVEVERYVYDYLARLQSGELRHNFLFAELAEYVPGGPELVAPLLTARSASARAFRAAYTSLDVPLFVAYLEERGGAGGAPRVITAADAVPRD